MATLLHAGVPSRIQVIIRVALLICILCAVALPELDVLPPIALAQRIAHWLLIQLATLAFVVRRLIPARWFRLAIPGERQSQPLPLSCLSVTCIWLC